MPVLIYGYVFKTELRGFPEGLDVSVREREKLHMNPSLFGWAIRKRDLPSNEMKKSMGAIGLEKGEDDFDMVSMKYLLVEMLG